MSTPTYSSTLLHRPYPLTAETINKYQQDGFIKLTDVFDGETLKHYGVAIRAAVAEFAKSAPPIEERTTYGKAFFAIDEYLAYLAGG